MTRLLLVILATLASTASAASLHSRPESPHTLYIDTDGSNEQGRPMPAFGGDVRSLWATVAGYFAGFDLDVTTVDPGNRDDYRTMAIVVGDGDWASSGIGGASPLGGFTNPMQGNTGYVFPARLADDPLYIARAVAHEAGHGFGLEHHAQWDGDTLIDEYDPGDAAYAPIMGLSYYAADVGWSVGRTPSGVRQDDNAMLAKVLGVTVPEPDAVLVGVVGGAVVGARRKRK